MRKLIVIRSALALLLGALTAIVFTWIPAWFMDPDRAKHAAITSNMSERRADPASRDLSWSVARYERWALTHILIRTTDFSTPQRQDTNRANTGESGSQSPGIDDASWQAITPRWARPQVHSALHDRHAGYLMQLDSVVAFGWPWRLANFTATHGFAPNGTETKTIRGGIGIWHPHNAEFKTSRGYGVTLPYRPIWPGLLANTAIFAAPWALLFIGIPLLRRVTRRRRGRCVRCGYDLRGMPSGAPCPECGLAAA